jgi:hypothetical protein
VVGDSGGPRETLGPTEGDGDAIGDDGADSSTGVCRVVTCDDDAESTARDVASGVGSITTAPASLTWKSSVPKVTLYPRILPEGILTSVGRS